MTVRPNVDLIRANVDSNKRPTNKAQINESMNARQGLEALKCNLIIIFNPFRLEYIPPELHRPCLKFVRYM